VRETRFTQATTKVDDGARDNIEITHKTSATFEDATISRSLTRVRNSPVIIKQCSFSGSPHFAIVAEYYAELTLEGNDFNKDKRAVHLKDNSKLVMRNNKIANTVRPAPIQSRAVISMPAELRVNAIWVRSFSKAAIEGNTIGGDYDYAICVDGQSSVDCLANQIQCGAIGGICYSGMSSGACDENTYTGKDVSHAQFFSHGCFQRRRAG
jgi:hypothetical protein